MMTVKPARKTHPPITLGRFVLYHQPNAILSPLILLLASQGTAGKLFIATQFSYNQNKSAWVKLVLSGDAIRCKTPYGHRKSSSSYLNATSLRYDFFGKSMVTCDIIVPNTFSAVKGRIQVQATRSHNYI